MHKELTPELPEDAGRDQAVRYLRTINDADSQGPQAFVLEASANAPRYSARALADAILRGDPATNEFMNAWRRLGMQDSELFPEHSDGR